MNSNIENNSNFKQRIKLAADFLKENNYNEMQIFNTRNLVGDIMINVYSENGIDIDFCPDYDYLEIFGLSDDELTELVNSL